MRFVKYTSFAVIGLLPFASLPTQADILVLNAPGPRGAASPTVPGQSVTTPVGGPFNALTFNFFDQRRLPTAAGTLFVLNQEYSLTESSLDTPANLSSSTPGFVAASQNIVGGQYVFDPTVTLQGATQYFFYANQEFTLLGDGPKYSGGSFYSPINDDITQPFINADPADAFFQLSGVTAVPEPSTPAFLTGSVFTGVAFLRRRKQTQKAV